MKKLHRLPYLLLTVNLFLQVTAIAQDTSLNTCIDINQIRLAKNISRNSSHAFVSSGTDLNVINPATIAFNPGLKDRGRVSNDLVTKKVLLKFSVCNKTDSTFRIYFFPGFYYSSIRLYRVAGDHLARLPDILPDNKDSIGFRLFSLAAHDSAVMVAELGFVKTYINTIVPRLVNPEYLDSFVGELHSSHTDSDLITYVFCGLLLMMILYSIANFLQGANPEFLYYSGYAFFLGTMLFTKAMFTFHNSRLSFFLESYLDFIMQDLGIMFYMLFMQRFLDTRSKYPFLYKLYNAGILLLAVSMLSYSFFHYFTDLFTAENLVENSTKVLLLIMIIIFLVYSLRHWHDKLLRYLFWGNLCLFVFSLFSQTIILYPALRRLPGIFGSSLFYYEMGLFLELVFFLAGLNFKNRSRIIEQTKERERLKADNLMKEYEKGLAVYKAQQEERERISADMHDELGSGMTAIRLMSEIARNKMKESTPVEIEKISHSANDVLNKMNAIIWSMNSGNDTLDNLVSYIRAYALEYLDNTPIHCIVNTPEHIPAMELTGDKRRNVFLCVKETLNNALKHSQASQITIDIHTNHQLEIRIADNGKGIDLHNLREFGNGLKNIRRRMESVGGKFHIENKNGTITTLRLSL